MRLVSALALIAAFFVWFGVFDQAPTPAIAGPISHFGETPLTETSAFQRAKIVCGQTPDGYRCRTEPGAIRRGKMPKMPKKRGDSNDSGPGWSLFGSDDDGGDPDALPSAPTEGATAAGACPPNSERLGGHCIPYTQTCNRGLEAGAPPQVCSGGQEKLVCDFRSDGLKDCCCRTYSQF